MKIPGLKTMAVPKVAFVAAALAGGLLVSSAGINPAVATPRAASCTGCHASDAGATTTVTATPSTATPAPGASYTVAITLTANPNGGNTGYGIVPVAPATEKTFGGNTGSQLSFTATMIAPTAAGIRALNRFALSRRSPSSPPLYSACFNERHLLILNTKTQ